MTWWTSTSVSVNNGDSLVSVNDGVDISNISGGDALIINNLSPVEVKRAYIDGGGIKTIELVVNWSGASQTNQAALVIPTSGDFKAATAALRNATDITSNNFKALEDWGTQVGTITFTGQDGSENTGRTLSQLDADAQAVIDNVNSLTGSVLAMSKAEFFANAKNNKDKYVGSGSVEWGKHFQSGSYPNINEGLWQNVDASNQLFLGAEGGGFGISRTASPIFNVNGNRIRVVYTASPTQSRNKIKFPDAPDGLDKNDGTRYTDLAAAIVDGGTSLANSVLTRQDFVFLEVWHEKISDKDQVYPLGNVQYGSSTWEGINLSVRDDGYTRFGEWDTSTTGRYTTWSSLTDEQKVLFLQDPENNIYSDNGELIQVRYRIRVIKGLGDEWVGVTTHPANAGLQYSGTDNKYVHVQGKMTEPYLGEDLGTSANAYLFYLSENANWNTNVNLGEKGIATAFEGRTDVAEDGLCFAVPIALVQRRNSLAYHQAHNPNGTAPFGSIANPSFRYSWWELILLEGDTINSVSDCYSRKTTSGVNGSIAGGLDNNNLRPDNKFYDAIYAEDVVEDLRMSARKPNLHDLHARYEQKALSAEIRGKQSVPFTRIEQSTSSANSNANAIAVADEDLYSIGEQLYIQTPTGYDAVKITSIGILSVGFTPNVNRAANAYIIHRSETILTAKSNKPTHTDIVGDPVNIKTMLDTRGWDGILGQWVPDFTNSTVTANEKIVTAYSRTYTGDNGVTWSDTAVTIDPINNTMDVFTGSFPDRITLVTYETQAKFLEEGGNSEVLVHSDSTLLLNHHSDGQLLNSSLFDKVPTGEFSGGQPQKISLENVVLSTTNNQLAGASRASGRPKNGSVNVGLNSDSDLTSKSFSHLTHESGQLYLQYNATEMKFNTDWGDTGEFIITKNPVTDDNGVTVLSSFRKVALPYFYNGE